ncbi:hypothetical protein HanRHA438_Chr02g0086121 [Helianthus annuus]|nr:hypothetical protein HanRHA438_Chr02g0086121 [Helianthus annuus]
MLFCFSKTSSFFKADFDGYVTKANIIPIRPCVVGHYRAKKRPLHHYIGHYRGKKCFGVLMKMSNINCGRFEWV